MIERPHVLVVDDDDAVRLVAAEMLRSLDCDVESAADGEAALALFENHHFDAIFLDVGMPIMNGVEVYERIRLSNASTQIFFMTGYAEEEFRDLDDPRTDVLSKPFSMLDLTTKVEMLLAD
ncbi:MAG: response regulator [Pseudomonadales bacterium]|nr:response regulator [Pseudomonadales bacterium]